MMTVDPFSDDQRKPFEELIERCLRLDSGLWSLTLQIQGITELGLNLQTQRVKLGSGDATQSPTEGAKARRLTRE
jgi:hypothetical protein